MRKIDFSSLVNKEAPEDHSICDQIYLMDDFLLGQTDDFTFTVPENLFVEVLQGDGYVFVNDIKYPVTGNCLISYLKGQVVRVKVSSRKTVQRCVAFSDEFMESLYHAALSLNEIRSSILLNPVTRLEEEQTYGLKVYISVLRNIAAKTSNPNNLMCAKYVTLALFYGPLYNVLLGKLKSETMRCPSVSSQFFRLLEDNFQNEHRLGFYADSLNISIKYLYECVSSATGKSPSYWIDYHMTVFAKKKLADPDLSVSQIAEHLHFAGLPSFSKFFKKQTGKTPGEYRKSLFISLSAQTE